MVIICYAERNSSRFGDVADRAVPKSFTPRDFTFEVSDTAMMKSIVLNIGLLFVASLLLTCITYMVDFQLFTSGFSIGNFHVGKIISPVDSMFLEGLLSIVVGVLFAIGSGGLTRSSTGGAMIAAAASAFSGKDTIGPDEVYRRNRWKAKGYVRFGLVLILNGAFLLVIYFLSLPSVH